jgi:ADP-ribose pyrophosphatase YjhB (NUDIX family)
MTAEEKLIIKSYNFEFIWYHMMSTVEKSNMYEFYKKQFVTNFGSNLELLKSLIEGSCFGNLECEYPKGRRVTNNEANVTTAIRELEEETGISHGMYKIIRDLKLSSEIIDGGIRYLTVYYVAVMTQNITPKIDLRNFSHQTEIQGIEFMIVKDIQNIELRNLAYVAITHIKGMFTRYKFMLNMYDDELNMQPKVATQEATQDATKDATKDATRDAS